MDLLMVWPRPIGAANKVVELRSDRIVAELLNLPTGASLHHSPMRCRADLFSGLLIAEEIGGFCSLHLTAK